MSVAIVLICQPAFLKTEVVIKGSRWSITGAKIADILVSVLITSGAEGKVRKTVGSLEKIKSHQRSTTTSAKAPNR